MVFKNSQYQLNKVKKLAKKGSTSVRINQDALDDARTIFGFNTQDILNTVLRISGTHYHKSDFSNAKSDGTILDVYKTRYEGEHIYIHFYIEIDSREEILVINSFHDV